MNHYHVFYNTSTFEAKRWCVATDTAIHKEFKTEAAAKSYAAKINANREARLRGAA